MIKYFQKIKPFWALGRKIWHSFAQKNWFMPILHFYVTLNVNSLSEKKTAPIKILALNSSRYEPDLEILNGHKDIVIYTLPHHVQTLINSIFYRQLPTQLKNYQNNEKYRFFRKLENGKERTALTAYLEHFLPRLLKQLKIDALMSCSFFYLSDIDWQRASANQEIPYFALHKENMQDPVLHKQMIARYSKMRLKFYGRRLFLYNHLVKKVILGAGICRSSSITVTGAARMDILFNKVQTGSIATPKRQITLFSSHHCIGLLQLSEANNYFSENPNEGFVEYFDLVHGHIIKFASENPDVNVYIKTKWGGNWVEQIIKSGIRMNFDISKISNLYITWERPAQNLIEESAVVIGINSTTLLESLIVGRPVILPLFAEAAGKYYDRHVYFKEYEKEVFNVVRTPDLLGQAILDELNGVSPKRRLPRKMISDYLGYYDDRATDRIVKQIKEDIKILSG